MQNNFPNQASYDLWKILQTAAKAGVTMPLGVYGLFAVCMEPQNELVYTDTDYQSKSEREIEF